MPVPPGTPCSIDGCEKDAVARGWCWTHWRRWRTTGDPLIRKTQDMHGVSCSVSWCQRDADLKAVCRKHYRGVQADLRRFEKQAYFAAGVQYCTKCGEKREANLTKHGFSVSYNNSFNGLACYCRICCTQNAAQWVKNHPQQAKETRNQRWTSGRSTKANQRFREQNPDKYADIHRRATTKRKRLLADAVSEPYSRRGIFERDGGQCQVEECLCPDGREIQSFEWSATEPWCLEIDHIMLVSDGGDDTPSNVRAAHRRCNGRRGRMAKDVRKDAGHGSLGCEHGSDLPYY